MKTWFMSLNGAITLSVLALLAFFRAHYVGLEIRISSFRPDRQYGYIYDADFPGTGRDMALGSGGD